MRQDGNYLKEILGTLLWIALIYLLIRQDGFNRCSEFLENLTR